MFEGQAGSKKHITEKDEVRLIQELCFLITV